MKKLLIITFLLFNSLANAKLLDKILAVTNDKIFTLSMASRIQESISARRNISPMIYTKSKYSKKEVIDLLMKQIMIRKKLQEMGYSIGDGQVETQIKNTEMKLGLSRKDLLNFLSSKGIAFDEYFELTREAIEYNVFNSRVIRPLISITEQEIKKKFYEENKSNKTIAFRYDLIDFSIDKKSISKRQLKSLPNELIKIKKGQPIPSHLENLQTNNLGNTTEDDLTNELKNILKKTQENMFSKPILLYDSYHVFFIKKKDLVESSDYLQAKRRIESMSLFTKNYLRLQMSG